MRTLTINVPDSVDPTEARWEMARALFEKGTLTLDQASLLAELAPTYFKLRLEKQLDPEVIRLRDELLTSAKPFNRHKFDELVNQLDIKESWEELVAQVGK